MVQRAFGAMNNDTLLSIPLFVLMGYVMERGALVDKMFHSVQLAFRSVPGSLAVTTLIICTFWGIASGLVGAVVVLMGVIAMRPDAQRRLRHAAGRRRDHRRRHAGHPDPALGDDHRVRGRRRPVGGQALCGRHVPRLLPGAALPDLRHRLGADQPEDRAQAAARADAGARSRPGCAGLRQLLAPHAAGAGHGRRRVAGRALQAARPGVAHHAGGMLLRSLGMSPWCRCCWRW
jgi:hypothetical protein